METPNVPPTGPGPKPPDLSWLSQLQPSNSDAVAPIGGVQQAFSEAEFDFPLRFGQDNRLLRAQNQGFGEQAMKTLGNLVPNVVTGLIEGIGYIPELWDDEQDYTNELTKQMQNWKNPLGEVYRENPDETFDLADPAWWLNHFSGLVESVGSFALEGLGAAKLLGGLAKGAATAVNAGRTGRRIASGAAELGTSALLAYTEGAMSGAQVYEKAYQENLRAALREGIEGQEAHAIAHQTAAEGAARTVQLNTLMNTALNLGSLSPLFRDADDAVLGWIRAEGRRLPGENLQAWKKRLGDAADTNPELRKAFKNRGRKGWAAAGIESQKEGLEEINTQYAEAEGERVAAGDKRSIGDALTDLGQYLDDITNEEGALNYLLGSIGGVGQTAVVDNVPVNRVIRYDDQGNPLLKAGADGKTQMGPDGKPQYQTQLVSAKTFNEFGSRRYFENLKDSIIHDIDFIERKQQELVQAQAKGNEVEVERIKGELFGVQALDAVRKGLTQSWVGFYEDLAKTDNTQSIADQLQPQIDAQHDHIQALAQEGGTPQEIEAAQAELQKLMARQLELQDVTEAMHKGLAKDMNDDRYKERARRSVEDLKQLQDMHEQIQRKYYDSSDPATAELTDHLFFRHADLYLRKRAIDQEEARLNKIQSMYMNMQLVDSAIVDASIDKYNDHMAIMKSVVGELQNDVDALREADKSGNTKVLLELIGKYRAQGVSEQDIAGSIQDLIRRINLKQKQYQTSIDTAKAQLETSSGFAAYQQSNPGKTFDDYIQTLGGNILLSQDKANLEAAKAQYQIAEDNLKDMMSGGPRKLLGKLMESQKQVVKKIDEKNRQQNFEYESKLRNQKDAARLQTKQKEMQARKLKEHITALEQQVAETSSQLQEAQQELSSLIKSKGVFTSLNKLIPLRERIGNLKRKLESLTAQLNTARDEFERLGVAVVETQIKQRETEVKTVDDLKEEGDRTEDEFHEEPEEIEHDPVSDKQLSDDDPLSLAATPEELEKGDPLAEYMELRKTLDPHALPILDKLQEKFQGATEVSYNQFVLAFRQLTLMEIVDMSQVNDAYFKFKRFILEGAAEVGPKGTPTGSPTEIRIEPPSTSNEVTKEAFRDKILEDLAIRGDNKFEFQLYVPNLEGDKNLTSKQIEQGLRNIQEGKPTKAAQAIEAHIDRMFETGEVPMNMGRGNQAQRIAIQLKMYMGKTSGPVTTLEGGSSSWKPIGDLNDPTLDDIPDTPDDSPEIVIDMRMFSQEVMDDVAWEDSSKVNNAVKVNSADLDYTTIVVDGVAMMRNTTTGSAPVLSTTANLERMVPNQIKKGDKVILQIDTKWQGQVLTDRPLEYDENLRVVQSNDRYEDYLDQDGKIRVKDNQARVGYGNVPIKIIHKNSGKVLGYLPRTDWIDMQQGAENFRNVEDLLPADKDGNRAPGNVERQVRIVSDIRRRLSQLHNNQPGATLETVISHRSGGHLMYAGDLTESTGRMHYKSKLAKNLLPDPNLQFGIMGRDKTKGDEKGNIIPMIGQGTPASRSVTLEDMNPAMASMMPGAPFVLLPMANGQMRISPLFTTQFQDRQADMHTVIRAVEIYLQHNTPHMTPEAENVVEKIKEFTGFDISTARGLKDYINQYFTFTTSFKDTETAADSNILSGSKKAKSRVMRFVFAIGATSTAGKAPIKVGVTLSGNKPIYAGLVNGKLDPAFMGALRGGLETRFKNVVFTNENLRGVNDNRPITEAIIDKNDRVKPRHFKNYNDYLRSFAYTSVYGLHKVNERYVYGANSQIYLSQPQLLAQESATTIRVDDPSDPTGTSPVTDDQALADDLFSMSYSPEIAQSLIQPTGVPVNLERLRQLYNFTSESDRNGKSPEDVLKYLQDLGLSSIADGYNPFLKCP